MVRKGKYYYTRTSGSKVHYLQVFLASLCSFCDDTRHIVSMMNSSAVLQNPVVNLAPSANHKASTMITNQWRIHN